MKFETTYKNIHFDISLEKESIEDLPAHLGDRFYRIPNQTMIELKKGNILFYNLVVISKKNDLMMTHFWPNVLFSKKIEELMEDVQNYLEDEDILDKVIEHWLIQDEENGPSWKVNP